MSIRTLAVDPGSRVVGWAAFEDERLVAHGVIAVPRGTDYAKTVTHIIGQLASIRMKHRCMEVALEKAFNWPGHNTAALQFAERAITSWAQSIAEVGRVSRYANGTWKAAIVGHGGASKDDVMATVRLLYPNLNALTEHESDAVAIGCYHQRVRRLEGMTQ